jgi:hypothetical protein
VKDFFGKAVDYFCSGLIDKVSPKIISIPGPFSLALSSAFESASVKQTRLDAPLCVIVNYQLQLIN